MNCLSMNVYFDRSCIFVSYSYTKVLFTFSFQEEMLQLICYDCSHSELKRGLAYKAYVRHG